MLDGLEEERVEGPAAATSSENIFLSCSSSNLQSHDHCCMYFLWDWNYCILPQKGSPRRQWSRWPTSGESSAVLPRSRGIHQPKNSVAAWRQTMASFGKGRKMANFVPWVEPLAVVEPCINFASKFDKIRIRTELQPTNTQNVKLRAWVEILRNRIAG